MSTDMSTNIDGFYNLVPIPHNWDDPEDAPAWRWLAIVQWIEPGQERVCGDMPNFVVRRHENPLRLMWWISALRRHVWARNNGGPA